MLKKLFTFSVMKINNVILLATVALLIACLSSCKVYPPTYRRVENFRIDRPSREGFKLGGDAVFYNPNKLKFSLIEMLINVEIDGKHVATAGQKTAVKVLSESEFAIPMDLTIKPDMGILEGIQNIIALIKTRELELTLNGTIVIKALGIKVPITFKNNQKIDLLKFGNAK